MDRSPTERFRSLFQGRGDVWGAVHGECKRETLTLDHWREHLFGVGSIGVYPLVPMNVVAEGARIQLDGPAIPPGHYVHWGCSDIDRGLEMLVLARNLHRALKLLGLTSWVERSKGKGYHIWVLASTWVPAEDMRRALLVAHQLAGVPPTEVNPKQTSTAELVEGLGNYVNLPYAKSFADMGKRIVLDHVANFVPMRLDHFLDAAEASLNSPEAVAKAAELYVPPPPKSAVDIPEYDGAIDDIVGKLGGLAYTIFNEGPTDRFEYKRFRTLQRLAYLCKEDRLSPAEAFAVIADSDARWGKFHGRPDAAIRLREIVERAYG